MRRSTNRSSIIFTVMLAASLWSIAPVRATWNIVAKFRRGAHSAFFFSEQVGFIGVTGDVGIYKTIDGGNSWQLGKFPNGFSGDITSIFMFDTLQGWASIEEPENATTHTYSNELWRTVDGGLNWTAYGPLGDASCVYQTTSTVVVTSRSGTAGYSSHMSTDGGMTFSSAPLIELTNGVDFVDAQHGVVTGFGATPWLKSADGGRNWQPIAPPVSDESWSVYGVKGTAIFYTAAERDPNQNLGGPSFFRRSTDYGSTWSSVAMPIRTTGHIAGLGEILYVQVDVDHSSAAVTGLYRSTDQGASWKSVGGPTTDRDTRFAVTGCSGGVVYAFDHAGNIWKTRDGGDGAFTEPPTTPVFNPPSLSLTSAICGTDDAALTFKNLYCRDMQVQIVGFVDSTLEVVAKGGLRFSHTPSLPKVYSQNEGDSIVLHWDPKGAYHRDTTITTKIRIRYYSLALQRVLDTVITISAHAIGIAPQFAMSPQAIVFDTIHPCIARDTIVTILNVGCDTLFVLGADKAINKGFALLDANGKPAAYPYSVAPAGVLRFSLHVLPGGAGNYASSIKLHFRHQGIARDSSVTVSAFVPFENVILGLSSLDIGQISICRTYDSIITIRNPGCDTLWLDAIGLKYGMTFSLPGLRKLPRFLLPDSSFSFVIQFTPAGVRSELDSLIVRIRALESGARLSVPVKATGVAGTPYFHSSLTLSKIDFGTHTHCDPPDSLIFTITNPGCVPMTMLGAQLEGAVAPGVTMTVSSALPKILIDGDTVKIIVHLSTAVRGSFAGNVHIQYQFKKEGIIDSLIAINAKVIHGSRILSIDTAARDLGQILYCETTDAEIVYQNTGCDSLTFSQRDLLGLGYIMLNPKQAPFGLAPGQRDTVKIRFIPVNAGLSPGALSIKSDADLNPSPTIGINTRTVPTDTLTFYAQASMKAKVGDTLGLKIFSKEAVIKRKLSRIKFTLNYNGDVLRPISVMNGVANSTIVAGPEVRSAFKTAYYPIEIIATKAELAIDVATPIVTVAFTTFISDSASTNLSFTDLLLNGGDPQYQKCSLGASGSNAEVGLTLLCGDSTIKNYFLYHDKMPLTAHPVYPDPSDRSSTIALPFELSNDGITMLTVVNSGGEIVYTTQIAAIRGMNHFEIPQASLTEGAFNYTITYQPTHNTKRGKFVVIR
jgi:photosystem II stability/assembly factor-like uncharacterized protein